MQKMSMAIGILLVAALVPTTVTMAHGSCAHETVHQYGVPGSADTTVEDDTGTVASPGLGAVVVNDSEDKDCDSDGVPADFDGDLDVGTGGGAFGHGPWATWCGFHQEVAGTVTVNDLVFGPTVSFVTGSGDTNSWVPDPLTGENTCVTDGVISPGTDPEGDDCLSDRGTGTQAVTCPGGGDGLLWVFIGGVDCTLTLVPPPPKLVCKNPAVVGTITSP